MNEEKLLPKRESSDFFFSNKIYDYSQKKLSDLDRRLMKKHSEKSSEQKRLLASSLMALEYLEDLKKTSLNQEMVKSLMSTEKRKRSLINTFIFSILLSMILLFGYLSYRVLLS